MAVSRHNPWAAALVLAVLPHALLPTSSAFAPSPTARFSPLGATRKTNHRSLDTPLSRPHGRPEALPGLRMAAGGQVTVSVKSASWAPMPAEEGGLLKVSCLKDAQEESPISVAWSAAGVVDSVGEGVEGVSVGDSVVLALEKGEKHNGKTLDVSSSRVVPLPKDASWDQAPTFLHVASLLLQGLAKAGISDPSTLKGMRVLVCGGSGPAGSLAIQAFAAAGAHVTACGEKELAGLGAEGVVQYKRESWVEELGGQVDLVVDALGSGGSFEVGGCNKLGIRYACVTNPVVKLVLSEGLFSGVMQVDRFNKGVERGGVKCSSWLTDEGVRRVRGLAKVLGGGVKGGLRFQKETYRAGEWMEAVSWPKDTDTGGRFGFPGENLWEAGEEKALQIIKEKEGNVFPEAFEEEDPEAYEKSGVQEVDAAAYKSIINGGQGKKTLVQFHSPKCRACKGMRPRFAKLAAQRGGDATFLSVDVINEKALVDELGIKDLPAFALVVDGRIASLRLGALQPKELLLLLEDML